VVSDGYEVEILLPWASSVAVTSGMQIGFDLMVGADDSGLGLQLESAIANQSVASPATYCSTMGNGAATPACDDRTWCKPALMD
jgi:hypothetical protein